MEFNSHWQLANKHAFLSASKYAWIRYDEDKLREVYANHKDAEIGTRLHNFAKQAIDLGIKLPRSNKTLNAFVNDALGYHMQSEQILWYSDNIFGTTDAISFRRERGSEQMVLRISDLKTGVTKASFDQLKIYAALFCLEYHEKPANIDIILCIYQLDEVQTLTPDLEDILEIMEKIIRFDRLINDMKQAAGL